MQLAVHAGRAVEIIIVPTGKCQVDAVRAEAGCWKLLSVRFANPCRAEPDLQHLVPGTLAIAIAAGGEYTCALLAGGRVDCWGSNGYGQLGIGSTATEWLVPAAVYLGTCMTLVFF